MDIMGLNSSDDNNIYIRHSSKDQAFMIGTDKVTDKKFVLDPATIQIGWGCYEGTYQWLWDDKPGVRAEQPNPDWKRAFSVWLYFKEVGPKLWRRHSWGEAKGFNQMLSLIWNDINANPGKVAAFEYVGCEVEKFKVGESAIPKFNFLAWTDKPAGFITSNVDNTNGNSTVTKNLKLSEDLPF